MRKKHILFIVENNPVPPDRRPWNEARAAGEYGYDVSVICPYDGKIGKRPTVVDGVNIYRHPRPREGSGKLSLAIEYLNAVIWEFALAVRIFIGHRFHAIHAANPPDHIFLIALPFKLFGVKFIFDHHDITPENFVAKFNSRGILLRLLYLMERLTFRTADLVISTNESYKKIAEGRGGKNARDVVVVRNGPDPDIRRTAGPNPKLRQGFRYLVGYVGVIGQQEGIENLLAAVEHIVIKAQRTDIKFIVVGTGPHWQAVVDLSRRMGLEKYVHFTGFISDADLYEILATVDLCVNPEFGNEFTDKSTMVKVMEYMVFGKPIVQFYTHEGKVTAGEAALFIRENSPVVFAEAMISLLDDEPRRRRMGEIGIRRIDAELGWPKQKTNLKIAYDRVFGK